MRSTQRQEAEILLFPAVSDLAGVRIDVELTSGELLSLRLPRGRAVGGGTCACEAPVARLTARRGDLLRERVFGGVAEVLTCLFGSSPDGAKAKAGDDPVDGVGDRAGVEGVEYLGSYDSVSAYLRAMLETEVSPACAWILDHLDYERVRRRWESDGSRLVLAEGCVYRVAGSAGRGDRG